MGATGGSSWNACYGIQQPVDCPGIGQVLFEKQPPSDLRKSNFFNFCTSFLDRNGHVISIIHASFHEFIENDREPESHPTRNGVLYKLMLLYANGATKKENLYVRLIDATTKEVVPYEGQDKNPEMRRVLITHEALCNRCGNNKSCGNKNETPSDPVITDQRFMKFFLKCNQNCLKVAGNPKDNRRFQIVVSGTAKIHPNSIDVYGVSEDMFVHNNSKHLRKKRKPDTEYDLHLNGPRIDAVHPKSGSWGTEIVVIGDNFQEGFQICISNTPIKTKMLTPTALSATVPALNANCSVPISLCYKNKPIYFSETTTFQYVFKELDIQIQRLANVLPLCQKNKSKVSIVEQAVNFFDQWRLNTTAYYPRLTAPDTPPSDLQPLCPIPLNYSNHPSEHLAEQACREWKMPQPDPRTMSRGFNSSNSSSPLTGEQAPDPLYGHHNVGFVGYRGASNALDTMNRAIGFHGFNNQENHTVLSSCNMNN